MATGRSEVDTPRDLYAEAVQIASRLARQDGEIGAVHVVAGRRPTYAELRTARCAAERWGVKVSVSADGGLALRRPAPVPVAAPDPPMRSSPARRSLDERIAAGVHRVVDDVRAWDAGFAGVREGTR